MNFKTTRKHAKFVVGLVLGLASLPCAWAADADGKFAIKGAGLAKCGQYVKQRDANSPDFNVYAGWIDGYVTALNRFQPKTYDLAPWQTTEILAGMVGGYCARHPDANFMQVVEQLAVGLAAERLQKRSPLVPATFKDQQVLIYPEVLKAARAALAKKGYLKSNVGNGFDETVGDALLKFQRDHKLPQNGLPNDMTLLVLFRGKA